jgi:DNA polymerase I-like protein with 3'-5' exonuclease and polymerase domains
VKVGSMDFETEAIRARPDYPPRPVGVALKSFGRAAKYWRWGHPDGNNCSRAEGLRHLRAFAREHTLLCHHAGFDLDVAETHCGLRWPAEHHDTLLLAFLEDPDSDSLSLKPLAERYLGEPPAEQDAVRDFVLGRRKLGYAEFAGATARNFGAYISKCPGELVDPYARGDVSRTEGLFRLLVARVRAEPRLLGAYNRELRATRALVRMERRGIPMSERQLRRDLPAVDAARVAVEEPLLRRMKVPAAQRRAVLHDYESQDDFKWSGKGFAERLLSSGLVSELPDTANGNYSTSAESLATVMPAKLAKEFEVRSQIATCVNTFMVPWLRQAEANGGTFYARFNQVRNGDEWGKKTGARTGRLSMTPNMQNVSRDDKDPRVPVLKRYVVTGEYGALLEPDYSQQELRLLAHYEDGPFLKSYLANPTQDAHILVRDLILASAPYALNRWAPDKQRRPVKDINFGLIYGQGLALTAEKLGVELDEARALRKAHSAALPGVPVLIRQLKELARAGEPIWTWGGRRYFCEKPAFIRGRWYNFEYKLVNVLIQGSAADVTKQAMVNYDSLPESEEDPMVLQVHDSLLVGVRRKSGARAAARRVDEAMRDISGCAVPMVVDMKRSATSWRDMEKMRI